MTNELGQLIGRGRDAEIYAWGEDRVLKLFFPSRPQMRVEVEAQATRVAHEAGATTPVVEEIIKVDDRYGIVFERIDGLSMTEHLATHLWLLRRVARQSAELQAAIHACKAPELVSLKDESRAWIEGSDVIDTVVKEVVLRRLECLPDGDGLCHGDFHPGNVIMSLRGPVVIDWDCGRRGDPLADVARTWVLIRMGEPSTNTKGRWLIPFLMAAYYGFHLRRYRQLRAFKNDELAAWQLPMVVLRLVRDNILPNERQRMMDYIKRALEGRMSD